MTAAHRFTTVSGNSDPEGSSPSTAATDTLSKTSSRRSETTYHWLSNAGHEPGVDVSRKEDEKRYGRMMQDKVRVTVSSCSFASYSRSSIIGRTDLLMSIRTVAGLRCLATSLTNGFTAKKDGDQEKMQKARVGQRAFDGVSEHRPIVRLILVNVDGLNWDVIKTLTLKYG